MQYILSFQMLQEIFEGRFFWSYNWEKFFLYYICICFSNLSYCFLGIILEFADFLFLSIDFFYSIFTIIIFCLEKGRCNSNTFYMSSKAGFFKSKAHVLYLLFIIIRILKFFECILISTTITSYRHNKNKIEK